MNAGLTAITISLLLFSLFLYLVINGIKNLLNSITITRSPSPAPAPAPSPSVSPVTITSDGIQFPKPSTTEGYMPNGNISCKKPRVVDASEFDNSIINGFSDYDSYEADRLKTLDEKWGENGWCKLAGVDEENAEGFVTAYQYHDGDYNEPVWDFDAKKCVFSGDDTPYACLYKEVKDAEGNVIGVENNKGEKLEVKFYNDYKSGKLQSYMESMGMGTRMKFLINDDGKLVLHKSGYDDVPAQKMVIKPGYNYPVTFMLLSTALTMVDNDIDMPATGIPTKFQTLTEDEIRTNMRTDVVDA
tara:strand:- start:26 stop:928 length:903 start_codon:yes stop_codon:yes gene_type:complete